MEDFLWNKYDVSKISIDKKEADIGIVDEPSVNFWFDKGRVSVFSVKMKWIFAIFNNDNKMVSFLPFKDSLSKVTKKRDEQLRSMMNTHGISNRNAPIILAQMASKVAEHVSEIRDVSEDPANIPFFKYVKDPSWYNIMKNLHNIQYIEDDSPYVIDCATFLGSRIIDDNPIHTLDIGPPGSGKSQFIKMMSPGMRPNKYVHPLSDLTSKSMVSGLEGNEDLYPLLDKKLVTMEEFTIMIAKDPTERGAILGQMRAMYGGHYSKTFGSGVGTKAYDSVFGFLAGCTSLIDTIAYEMSVAGHRDICIRRPHDIKSKIHERAVDAAYDDVIRDPKLTEAIQDELFSLYESFDQTKMPDIPDNMAPYIKNCAHITAFLRVAVVRDKFSKGKDMEGEPAIEYGTRLVKVYKKLARIIAWMLEKPEVDPEVISYVYRVALDTPTANRVSLLRILRSIEGALQVDEICEVLRLPKNTVKVIIEDLTVSDIIDEMEETIHKPNGDDFTIKSYYLDKDSLLYDYITHIEMLLDTLPDEQVHHHKMAESGIKKWQDKNTGEITIDSFDHTAHGEEGEHEEPDHTFVPDTSHLTVHDDDPEWHPEPEREDEDEPKTPLEVPDDPNAEDNDPNMEE